MDMLTEQESDLDLPLETRSSGAADDLLPVSLVVPPVGLQEFGETAWDRTAIFSIASSSAAGRRD